MNMKHFVNTSALSLTLLVFGAQGLQTSSEHPKPGPFKPDFEYGMGWLPDPKPYDNDPSIVFEHIQIYRGEVFTIALPCDKNQSWELVHINANPEECLGEFRVQRDHSKQYWHFTTYAQGTVGMIFKNTNGKIYKHFAIEIK